MYRWHYNNPVLTQKGVASFSALQLARPPSDDAFSPLTPSVVGNCPRKEQEAGSSNLTTNFIFLPSATSSYVLNASQTAECIRGRGHRPAAFSTAPAGFGTAGQQLADRTFMLPGHALAFVRAALTNVGAHGTRCKVKL